MDITDKHVLAVEAVLNNCMERDERTALTEVMAVAYAHPGWGPRQRMIVMLDLAKTLFCEEEQMHKAA